MSPFRTVAAAVLICLGGAAQAGPAADPIVASQLASSWEVLWHQSGVPTRVARWHKPITVQIKGLALDENKPMVLKALTDVTDAAGLSFTEVTTGADLTVEIVPDSALEDREPCVTYMDMHPDSQEIERVDIKMRVGEVHRCAWHESMHAMGLRGHPSGPTQLSYFNRITGHLLPLDRIMLRAWYSPAMKTGMTPFEALPVLADEVVCNAPDRDAALQMRDAFIGAVLGDMRNYLAGTGDIPAIVKKSGKATEAGMKRAKVVMATFLDLSSQSAKPFSELQCKSPVTYSTVNISNQP